MKIGIYAPFYHPFEGGAERVARRVANELAKNHDVVVFTLQFDSALPLEGNDGPVHVRRFPYLQTKPFGLTRMRVPLLLEALAKADLDVLQIHGVIFPNIALAVAQLLKSYRIPTLLVPHGLFEAFQGDKKQQLLKRSIYLLTVRPLLAALIWRSSHIAITSPEERKLLAKYMLPESHSTLVYNGFEPPLSTCASGERFRHHYGLKDAQIIFHVASIKPNKGHKTVIRALPEVLARFPNTRYVVVGQTDGLWHDYAQDLIYQVQASGIAENVVFTGHVTDEMLADAYAASDIVVLPSLAETFPLTVLDAMAWQKPVIASNVGGVSYMLEDRQSGLIVPPGDVKALAQALLDLLPNQAMRDKLGRSAVRTVTSKFDWQYVIERYEAICFRLRKLYD